jgi:uncharacterized membrane protein (DUF485 family)
VSGPNKKVERARGDLVTTAIVATFYFAYMLCSVDLRPIFAQPITPGAIVPWGLVGGIAVVALVMAAAGLYMALRAPSADDAEGGGSVP